MAGTEESYAYPDALKWPVFHAQSALVRPKPLVYIIPRRMWEARLGTAPAQGSEHSKVQALAAYGLAFALAIAPTLAVFLPRALAPLFVLAVLTALPVVWRRRRQLSWPPRPLLWALAAFHLWQAVSIIWCLDPAQALRSTAGMAGLSLGGTLLLAVAGNLPDRSLRLIRKAALLGLLVGGLVFAVEAVWGIALREALYPRLTGQPFTHILFPQRLNRASTIMALLALPVGYELLARRRWVMVAAMMAVVAVVVAVSPSATAKICFILGPVVALAAWGAARPVALALKAGFTVVVIAIPFVIAALPDSQTLWNQIPSIPNSTHHRLTIWKFSADRVMERPVLGWGMDASRDIPGGEDQIFVYPPPALGGDPHHEQLLPLHPHNTALQWWLELGGIGAGLGLAVLLTLVTLLQKLDPPHRAVGFGLLVQGVLVSFISFGAWQSWWFATLWLLATLVLAQRRLGKA
jgi:O-antigen ligase